MTPGQEGLSPVEKLDATHDVDSFACGKEPLDRFLKRFALANQKADSARTYVACRGLTRYCQKLWMGLAQAASFLMPSTKGTPLMTSTIN